MSNSSPPKIFLRFFRWSCHPKLKDSIEGDLMELFQDRKTQSGRLQADVKLFFWTLVTVLYFADNINTTLLQRVNDLGKILYAIEHY